MLSEEGIQRKNLKRIALMTKMSILKHSKEAVLTRMKRNRNKPMVFSVNSEVSDMFTVGIFYLNRL